MDEFWGITIILFIILTVFVGFLVRVMSYYSRYHLTRHTHTSLARSLPTLKSGDIILFISHTHGFTNSLFTWDLYTHAGVVVKTDGELLISESTVDSAPGEEGEETSLPESSQLNPLIWRLRNYRGMCFLMSLENPLTPQQEGTLWDRAQIVTPYPSMFDMVKAVFRVPVHRRARHCMQHVAWLLDEIGLTPDSQARAGKTLLDTGFFGSSRAVTALSGESLGDGVNKYGPVTQLLFDVDIVASEG